MRDRFDGKGHAATANAIAHLVLNEDGGRVIGLEGEWGSGKSTVVRILADSVRSVATAKPSKDANDTRVFLFDAWAHQSDPLRRTFLETLLKKLVEWEWITKEEGKKNTDSLTGRRVIATTEERPALNHGGPNGSCCRSTRPGWCRDH